MPLLASGEVSGFQVPGAITSRCEAGLLRGTYERCRGESTDQTHISVVTDEALTVGWKLLEQGPKSQADAAICSGGVRPSLAPPISMHTLSEAVGHQAISLNAHCLSGPNYPMLDSVCLTKEREMRALSRD